MLLTTHQFLLDFGAVYLTYLLTKHCCRRGGGGAVDKAVFDFMSILSVFNGVAILLVKPVKYILYWSVIFFVISFVV